MKAGAALPRRRSNGWADSAGGCGSSRTSADVRTRFTSGDTGSVTSSAAAGNVLFPRSRPCLAVRRERRRALQRHLALIGCDCPSACSRHAFQSIFGEQADDAVALPLGPTLFRQTVSAGVTPLGSSHRNLYGVGPTQIEAAASLRSCGVLWAGRCGSTSRDGQSKVPHWVSGEDVGLARAALRDVGAVAEKYPRVC